MRTRTSSNDRFGREMSEVEALILEQVGRAGFIDDVPTLPGWSRDEVLSAVEGLVDRGWLDADGPNRGDDRLLSVWGLRSTETRAAALVSLQRASGTDMPDAEEPPDVGTRIQDRRRFMTAMFEATGGSRDKGVNMWGFGETLGMNRRTTNNTVDFLEGEALIEYVALGGEIVLTHAGIREVEDALAEPEKPTAHLPSAVNIIHVDQMMGSQISQGSVDSSQAFQMSAEIRPTITSLVQEVRQLLPELGLDPEDESEMSAELATIDSQLGSSRPKRRPIRDAVERVAELLTSAASVGGATAKAAEVALRIHEVLPLI